LTPLADEGVLRHLIASRQAGRLAHAYIFAGPDGIGKYATALAVAARVNCLAPSAAAPCACVACRRTLAGEHPDIAVIAKLEDKEEIGISQVRAIMERLSFRAFEGQVRFVVIRQADALSTEAANALLKSLEEPRPDTVFILTTTAPDAIPATVRSRCQTMLFAAAPQRELARALQSGYDITSDEAWMLAAYGQGSPGRAAALGKDFLERRRAVIDACFVAGDTESFIKTIGTDRALAREALRVILTAVRDALFIKAGAPAVIINRDRAVELKRFAERHAAAALAAQADRVSDAIRRVDGNQNLKIVLTVVREMLSV
jgi:DNA polymerase-3 subunit delta'